MNILLINLYAGQLALGKEYRPDCLARQWVRLAHHVTRVARRIAQPARARRVHEVHDLWPLSPVGLSGMLPRLMGRRGLGLKTLSIVSNGISQEEWLAPSQPLRQDLQQAIAPPAVWEAAA